MLIKGGCGKTTISTNVASQMAANGYDVLFIDADPQGNATSTLGPKDKKDPGDYNPSMADFLENESMDPMDVIVTETLVPNIHLFPNNLSAAHLNLEPFGTAASFLNRLQGILPSYDYVFFDCPPEARGLLSNIAIMCSDYVIAPIDGMYAANNLNALLDMLKAHQMRWNPKVEFLGVVLNHWHSKRVNANDLKTYLKVNYPEVRVFNSSISTSEQIKRAQAQGTVVHNIRGSGPSQGFQKLAKEITQLIASIEKEKAQTAASISSPEPISSTRAPR